MPRLQGKTTRYQRLARPWLQGLDSGYYALQVRAVDAAGNVGADQAPWPFQVDASLDSKGGLSTTMWIIIGAAGGTALLVVSGWRQGSWSKSDSRVA